MCSRSHPVKPRPKIYTDLQRGAGAAGQAGDDSLLLPVLFLSRSSLMYRRVFCSKDGLMISSGGNHWICSHHPLSRFLLCLIQSLISSSMTALSSSLLSSSSSLLPVSGPGLGGSSSTSLELLVLAALAILVSVCSYGEGR